MKMIEKANRYIASFTDLVDPRYRPVFHAVAPVGWINDPNGFCLMEDGYHLFYQHYPYAAKWNDMHWGHWRSADLAHWENLPVVMAPDEAYDRKGVFSGTAFVEGDKAYILYTGVHGDAKHKEMQEQCLAVYEDGRVTKDAANPVIPFAKLPKGYRARDFRDPCLMRTEQGWSAVMYGGHKSGPQLVSFTSTDLHNWTFGGVFTKTRGVIAECPGVFEMEGKTVVFYSEVNREKDMPEGVNPRPVVYSIGSTDERKTHFEGSDWRVFDHGFNCYALEVCQNAKEPVAIGWIASWRESYPTETLGHEWAGMMTLPRKLEMQGDRLFQRPAPGLYAMRQDEQTAEIAPDGQNHALAQVKHGEIEIDAQDDFSLRIMETGEERVELVYSAKEKTLTLDRTNGGLSTLHKGARGLVMRMPAESGKFEIFVDACAIEVFCAGEAMTAMAFPVGEHYGVSIRNDGAHALRATCWQMK